MRRTGKRIVIAFAALCGATFSAYIVALGLSDVTGSRVFAGGAAAILWGILALKLERLFQEWFP